METSKSEFESHVSFSSHTIKWTLKNFARIKKNYEIHSPTFRPLGNSNWQATIMKQVADQDGYLTLNGNDSVMVRPHKYKGPNGDNTIQVLRINFSFSDSFGVLHFYVRVQDKNGAELLRCRLLNAVSSTDSSRTYFLPLAEKSDFYNYDLLSSNIEDGILSIEFQLNFSDIVTSDNTKKHFGVSNDVSSEDLESVSSVLKSMKCFRPLKYILSLFFLLVVVLCMAC